MIPQTDVIIHQQPSPSTIPRSDDGDSIQTETTHLLATTNSSARNEQAAILKRQTGYIYLVAGLSAIGGFLFGYDTGIISGAMLFIKDEFGLNDWWQEAVVSSTLLTAWLFSIISGWCTNQYGRKPTIICSSVIFIAGSLLLGLAPDKNRWFLVGGRLTVGAGVGLASMTAPMYIAEVSPSEIRGQLLLIYNCCVTGGQSAATLIAYIFTLVDGNQSWRYMLGIAAIPALIQLLAFLSLPESPRWLVSKRRIDEARKVLELLRHKDADIDSELAAIRNSSTKAKQEQHQLLASLEASQNFTTTHNNNNDISHLCPTTPEHAAIIAGLIDGNNSSLSPELNEVKRDKHLKKVLSVSTFTRIINNESCWRALVVGCMLQLIQQLSGINTVMYYSASIFEKSGVSDKKTSLLLNIAASLTNFIFTIVGYILVERLGRRKLMLGSLFGVTLSLCFIAYGFSLGETYKVGITVAGMVAYLIFFAPGMGPMPWTINSEIYPSWARSWCLSATTSVNWITNLFISMTFLSLAKAITDSGAFCLYAFFSLLGFIFFYFTLPETRGKTLEELESLFAPKHYLYKDRQQNFASKC